MSTNRIDSIMKQYQFQRLNNNNSPPAPTISSPSYNPPGSVVPSISSPTYNSPLPQGTLYSNQPLPLLPAKKLSQPQLKESEGVVGTNMNPMYTMPVPRMPNNNSNNNTNNTNNNSGMSQQSGSFPAAHTNVSNNSTNPFITTSAGSSVPYRHGVLPPLPLDHNTVGNAMAVGPGSPVMPNTRFPQTSQQLSVSLFYWIQSAFLMSRPFPFHFIELGRIVLPITDYLIRLIKRRYYTKLVCSNIFVSVHILFLFSHSPYQNPTLM